VQNRQPVYAALNIMLAALNLSYTNFEQDAGDWEKAIQM
jgi:hypothetical protein